ncbi:MAG: hypothetical protein IV089_05575 [Thiobacillus sp.]|nr:hypothetical protein [Thiobacillus sp.]
MLPLRWGVEWQHDTANFALGGGNLLILLIGFYQPSRLGWQISLVLVGLTSFGAWYANLKRYRTVADTPTSRIASAPQGYIEIVGRGKQPPGVALASPLTGLPCLWYRYRVERQHDNHWEYVSSGISTDTFGVDDGSGRILIDPEGAEIITPRKQVSNSGGYRTTEWTLIEGETIYVIGEHVTLGGPGAVFDKKADLSALLTEWKQNKPALLGWFDANRDGEISLDEWEHARQTASREVDRDHFNMRLSDGIHLIQKPAHGQAFLIANREVTSLVRHFRLWSWAHLGFMLAALLGLILIAH